MGSVTSISRFQHSRFGSSHFADAFIFRYNRTGNDIVKRATTLSTATLSHGSSNYSNTTDLDAEIWFAIDPREVNDAIRDVQRKARARVLVPLSGGRVRGTAQSAPRDFDMEASGVAWWDGTSGNSAATNITPTKSATDLFSGTQALLLTATGASGSVRGERLSCQAGKSFYSAAIVRADVGTIGFNYYDVTNAAVFSSPGEVTYTGEEWALAEGVFQVPTGCEEMQARFSLSGATDIGYVDCIFGPYFAGSRIFGLPDWMDETYELKALRPARHRVSIADRTYDAFSREFYDDWVPGQGRFEMVPLERDVRPAQIQTYQNLPQEPIWISAERDLFQAGQTLATESSTTTHDLDQMVALSMVSILEDMLLPRGGDPELERLLAKYKGVEVVEEIARPSLPRKERAERRAWVA